MSAKKVLLSIRTVQSVPGQRPEIMELQTEGTLTQHPDHVELSYVESEMTGLEGVTTTFSVYGENKVILTRHGEKLNNEMQFFLGEKTDSLYDVGFGALLITVCAREIHLDLQKGEFQVSYTVEVEHTPMGTNTYVVRFRDMA